MSFCLLSRSGSHQEYVRGIPWMLEEEIEPIGLYNTCRPTCIADKTSPNVKFLIYFIAFLSDSLQLFYDIGKKRELPWD